MSPAKADQTRGAATRASRQSRPRRKHGTLSRTDIVDAGLALAAEVGFETINIRALSARLDCSPMAIYSHIDGKEDLLQAMADRAIDMIELPAGEDNWVDWYVDVALSYWSMMCRYPGLDAYILTRGPVVSTPSSIDVTTRMFDVLLRAGFEPAAAATVWRTAHTYLSGYAILTRSASYASPDHRQTSASDADKVFAALNRPVDEHTLESDLRQILSGFAKPHL